VQLNRQWIAAHIPHQGAMCLLDEVLDWSASEIRCRTRSHCLADNPLRTGERLRALCGIEYAAQAIAVHGALITEAGGNAPRPGMLAGVRNVELEVERLDDINADLIVRGVRLGGDSTALLYGFSLSWDLRELVAGRATILLRAPAAIPAGATRPR